MMNSKLSTALITAAVLIPAYGSGLPPVQAQAPEQTSILIAQQSAEDFLA